MMHRYVPRVLSKCTTGACALAFSLALSHTAIAGGAINTDTKGRAMHGFDPVAYYFDRDVVAGRSSHAVKWNGASYSFASDFNRKAFLSNPDFYLAQFDGFCAFAATMGQKVDVNPKSWAMVDGKLYFFNNDRVKARWMKDVKGNIAKGMSNWQTVS